MSAPVQPAASKAPPTRTEATLVGTVVICGTTLAVTGMPTTEVIMVVAGCVTVMLAALPQLRRQP